MLWSPPISALLQSRNMVSETPHAQVSPGAEIGGQPWLEGFESALDRHSGLIAAFVVALGFFWRLWLAQATFFNADEAWHFALANQPSAVLAYKASLTISHPPLLILLLHFWSRLGTSNLPLRLPSVIAGSLFCWIFYRWLDLAAGRAAAWAGLILATFLGPMISTSAEVRQNPFLLMFAVAAIYFFDGALSADSVAAMLASSVCLWLAMLSHYSGFFVAGALGVYSIVRLFAHKPSTPVTLTWLAGQIAGVILAGFLYKTHLGRLSALLNQALLPQQYLYSSYFHPGQEHLLRFLYRGTFGVFRFVFGQTQIGQFAALLFAAGIVLLFLGKGSPSPRARARALGILLLLPFALNWVAAAGGVYPFGRMRQCMFLAIFCLAGVSVCLSRIVIGRSALAATFALLIVVPCQVFGTLQDRDAFPLAEQRQEHMGQAIQFIRNEVLPGDVILTDKATSYQLLHYLCDQKRPTIEPSWEEFEVFRCEQFLVLSTGPDEGALTAQSVTAKWQRVRGFPNVAGDVWVVQGGWASGLGEALRTSPAFSRMELHSFGRYLEILKMPAGRPRPSASEP
jgi:hypothetical protein